MGGVKKMVRNRVVVRKARYQWRRKTKTKNKTIAGSINASLVIAVFVFLSGMFYLYSINSNAVKGYQIRCVEKKLAEQKKENEQLRIQKAELNSLYRLKEESGKLNMSELKEVVYIEESGPIALK